MAPGMEVGLGPGHMVLVGEPAPLPKRGQGPQFSINFYCGQTGGWIKMKLHVQVGLGPGDIVLDGHPAPPATKLWPYGWIVKMSFGAEVGLVPGDFVLDGDPAAFPKKGAEPLLPNFRPMCIVAKRQTARCMKMPLGMEVGLSRPRS